MGKRRIFSKIRKWIIGVLILAAFLAAGKQEKEVGESNFFQIGKEVFKNSFTKQIMYSQSMILGILMEQEFVGWRAEPVMKAEGFLPYEEQNNLIVPGQDMEEQFWKENEVAVHGKKEEFLLKETGEFVPVTRKQREIRIEDYKNIEELVKGFYTVDPTTDVEEAFLNVYKHASFLKEIYFLKDNAEKNEVAKSAIEPLVWLLSYHLTALSETENDAHYKDKIIKMLDALFDGNESDFIAGIRKKASK